MNIMLATLLISFFIATTFGMFYLYLREKKKKEIIEERLFDHEAGSESNLQSRAKFSELGLMSAGITHEINNCLSIIQLRSEQLLKNYRLPESQKLMAEGLNQIVYTTERMSKIVKGIRELIYQDESEEEAIRLNEIIDNVLIFCGQRLKNHDIEIRLINTDKIFVNGNRVQLEQAILNLINNSFDAVDHLPTKWIEINAVEVDDWIDIYVRDSGHGIPTNVRAKMMEPFYTTKEGKGTGLGLPLVRGIARKHGGDLIYVDQAPHTTFMLELPKKIITNQVPSSEIH